MHAYARLGGSINTCSIFCGYDTCLVILLDENYDKVPVSLRYCMVSESTLIKLMEVFARPLPLRHETAS